MKKYIIKLLFVLAFTSALLHYAGNMTWRLTIVFTFLAACLWSPSPEQHARIEFRPFTVRFTPHVYPMLNALGLITDAEWQATFSREPTSDAWTGVDLCRNGRVGYAINLDPDGMPVVDWPRHHLYTTGLGFLQELEFVKLIEHGTAFFPECLRAVSEGKDKADWRSESMFEASGGSRIANALELRAF